METGKTRGLHTGWAWMVLFAGIVLASTVHMVLLALYGW
jgi:hypothetical protein